MEGLLRIGHKSLKFVQNFVRSKAVLCFLVLLFAFYVFYCTPVVFFEPKGVGYSILNSTLNATLNSTLNATLNSNFNATQRKHLSLFGAIHVELDKPKTPHVWLLLGAHRDIKDVTFACYSTNRNGDVRKTAVGISPLHPAPMQCLWIVYRAKCDVVDDMTEFRIADGGVDAEFRGEKIPYRIPDKTHRHVVVCQSRFFMYDKWQILFTMLELYRFYGVDLIAVYVESIIAEAYNILKAYQERGFIAIHSAVKYENFEDLDYDPNLETEWNQQVSAYQLCLYEYRETTDFIIFGDWDEVLIPQNTTNLHEELKILLGEFPNAAAFYFQRVQVSSYIPKQASFFDMGELLSTTKVTERFGAPKVAVVGNRAESMGIHKIFGWKPRTREVTLTTEYSKFLHFRDSGNLTYDDEINELFPMLNTTQLAENFTTFIDQEGLYSNFVKLPSDLVYSDSFRQCYLNLYTTLGHPEWGICPNYLVCPQPEHAIPCVKLDIQFGRVVLREEVVLSYPKRTMLYIKSDGCR